MVCLSVGLFVCLVRSVCFFVSLFYAVQRPRLGLLFYLLCRVPRRNSSALASRGRHGGRVVQQHPGDHQELPRLRRQEQGVVSNIQKQAARLPVSLQQAIFEVFQGKAQPSSTLGSTDTATLNSVAEHKRLQANQDLWSVLLLTTSGYAINTVKKSEGKRPENGAGHGHLAWKALTEEYNGHTKEARRACHEKNSSTRTWSSARIRTTYFSFWTNAVISSRKWDRQHTTRGTRTSFSKPFRPSTRGCEAPATRRNFGLDAVRHMIHTMYVDDLSRSVNAKPIAGRGVAMEVQLLR